MVGSLNARSEAMDDALLPAAMPDVNAMMGDFVRQNPQLAWLPQLLAMRHAGDSREPDTVAVPQAEHDELREALARAEARQARLERINRRLAGDLDVANCLLSDLAAAFGACGLCWGEDPGCPSCRGRGKPGRFAADTELALRFGAAPGEGATLRASLPTGTTERR
jgi:hypothetical protein